MMTNKDACLPEPDKETAKSLEYIKKMGTLAEKIEQIGCETQFMISDCNFTFKNAANKSEIEDRLYQLFGNICYYMNYLRELVVECPVPLKHSIEFIDENGKNIFED